MAHRRRSQPIGSSLWTYDQSNGHFSLEGVTEDHPIIQRLQRMFYSLLNEQNEQLEKRLRTVIEDKVGGVR